MDGYAFDFGSTKYRYKCFKKILNTITSTNKKEDNYHLNYWKKIITNYSMTKDRDKDAQNIEKSKIELI